jgi:hypothetical protein
MVTAGERGKKVSFLRNTTGPAEWWLTEFEDNWPYQPAQADVYFSRDTSPIERPPIIEYVATPLPTEITVWARSGPLKIARNGSNVSFPKDF